MLLQLETYSSSMVWFCFVSPVNTSGNTNFHYAVYSISWSLSYLRNKVTPVCSSRWNKPLELKGQYIPGTRCLLSAYSWYTVPAQCIFPAHGARSVHIPGTRCPLGAYSWHTVPAQCIFLAHGARFVHIPGTRCPPVHGFSSYVETYPWFGNQLRLTLFFQSIS